MKLELKHLASYFPYRLKVEYATDIYLFEGLIGKDGIFVSKKNTTLLPTKQQFVKPILRPLSDLTKEIEYGGKDTDLLKFICDKWGYRGYAHILENIVSQKISFSLSQKLFEWHYDVFGLIEAGLAIDINTLK